MDLREELHQKKICRFCLALPSASLALTEIYGKAKAAAVPLPLQIMAATGMEVYESDGLPTTICFKCRVFTLHVYKFKQMARKAEEQLRSFTSTGIWPEKLRLPFEQIVVEKSKVTEAKPMPEISPPPAKQKKLPTKPRLKDAAKIDILNTPIVTIPMSVPESPELIHKPPPKILNKCPVNAINNLAEDQIEIVSVMEVLPAQIPSSDDGPAIVIDTQVYACTLCERSFPLRQLLDIHIKGHQRERKFGCQWCDKHFFSKYDLAKHTMTHTGDKPHICQICQKSFSRTTLLARHQKIHSDAPKFLCTGENCDQYFFSAVDLSKHMESKHTKRPFPCKKCDKSFAFKQGLERHEAVMHENNQPFVCEYCDEGFASSGKLARHLTVHSKYRRYPCKYCAKSFKLSHHLTRHLRSHINLNLTAAKRKRKPTPLIKPVTEPYKCHYTDCDEAFTTKDKLIYHSAVHATESLMCPLCNEVFEDIEATTSHIELHSMTEQFVCPSCDLIFVTEGKMLQHYDACHALKQEHDEISNTMDVEPFELASKSSESEIQLAIQKLSKCVTVTREKRL